MATAPATANGQKYRMTISRLTVDKLGVRLYDKVSAVLAELVANSYDADATLVTVKAPMGELLARVQNGKRIDKGYAIEVSDDGYGMTDDQVNDWYLRVGAERRNDPKRGARSPRFDRKVMGRKGVGKLAPFGICQKIEVITAGGPESDGLDAEGRSAHGFVTAHLILDRDDILTDSDSVYYPEVGPLDGTIRAAKGTNLRLTDFSHRHVPSLEDLERQLAQRFGITSGDWNVRLVDSLVTASDPAGRRHVGDFPIDTMTGTKLKFEHQPAANGRAETRRVFLEGGDVIKDLEPGFDHEGRFYPVTGWVAYAKEPYRDDLMAGVRIYCNRKIAAQTAVFNRRAGFTGEHDVRSYMVGALNADWLDEDEDLIQTDRRDILWSHELGAAFETWGRRVIAKIGTISRDPLKKKTWDIFLAGSQFETRLAAAYPGTEYAPIRDSARVLAKLVGQRARQDELQDATYLDSIVQLSITLAPHVTLDEKLREAAAAAGSPLSAITSVLRTARLAELSSFGRIAEDRVKVIERVETLKDDGATLESVFQTLIAEAPWLIDPQWSPLTANQTFATLKSEFAKYYKNKTGEDIALGPFSDADKRADFVLSSQDSILQLIEIKRPGHRFDNADIERLDRYVATMTAFLEDPTHTQFQTAFRDFHVTLVCDGDKLTGVSKTAYDGLLKAGRLTHMDWSVFLLKTRRMHEAFLEEAGRQRKLATDVP